MEKNNAPRRITREDVRNKVSNLSRTINFPIRNFGQLASSINSISINERSVRINDLRSKISERDDFPINNAEELISKADRLYDKLKREGYHGPRT
jgi:hypothetical protein